MWVIASRQAGPLGRDRERDRHLAILPPAELAAVLARHPDRELALLRQPGVVDQPGPDRAPLQHRGKCVGLHRRQQGGASQAALATKWCKDWCAAPTRAGSTLAAIGSTLSRSPGNIRPVAEAPQGARPSVG